MVVSLFFKFIQAEVFGSTGISHLQCSLKGYRKKKKYLQRAEGGRERINDKANVVNY